MAQTIRAGQTVSSVPFGYDRNGRPIRLRRRRKLPLTLGACLAYPLVDGPGIAMLVTLPPFLAIMALPVFDMLVKIRPGNVLNPINLLILPFAMPLIGSFALTMGYIFLYLGRVLASSSLGEDDHPRWPKWDRHEILEELGRWTWSTLMGLAIGGFPALAYWIRCGQVDWLDWFLFVDLAIVGVAYAQMALVAALLHESLLAANPVTVLRSIATLGLDYLKPSLVSGFALVLNLVAWDLVLLHSPSLGAGLAGLWACWVGTLYSLMVVFRVLGATYDRHADTLGWFRTIYR